jgi:hypothetical protein
MKYTPRRTHLHLLALCVLIAPAAFARNFGPQTGEEKTGQAQTGQAAPQNDSGAAAAASSASNAAAAAAGQIVVPAGTRLPLVLHNSITTRSAKPGDPLYLETTFPILVNDRIVIPSGTFVQGEITEAKRAAKGKGGAEVRVRLTSLVLPNGYTAKFDAVPTNAGTGGSEYADKNKEGQITNDRDKAADAGTVIKTTGVGAGIGAIAKGVEGAGVGAAVGATAGLAAVFSTRGPEVELPRGSSLDVMLDRPLYLDAARINFTDPGRASQLPGPPSREPVRARPF